MKYILPLLGFLLFSCVNNKKYPQAENALDAGREFIDACLKADFKRAEAYMLHDSINDRFLNEAKYEWGNKTTAFKNEYKRASINIESIEAVTDSITIINYKNSFDKITRKVKVVSLNSAWMVDFKYTFNGNL